MNALDELSQLEERIRNGDTSVTPAALSKARQAAEMAALHLEAEERAARRAEEEAAEAQRQAVRDQFAGPLQSSLEAGRDAYAAAVTALRTLRTTMDCYNRAYDGASAAYRRMGIVEELAEHSPLRSDWIHDYAISEARDDPPRGIKSPRRRSLPHRHQLHSDEAYALLCAQVDERDDVIQRRADEAEEQRQSELAAQRAAAERRAAEIADRDRKASHRHNVVSL